MKLKRLLVSGAAGAMLAVGAAAAVPAEASSTASALEPRALARAQAIRGQAGRPLPGPARPRADRHRGDARPASSSRSRC